MTRRERVTRGTQFGSVMRWLAVPAVLLCAIGSAYAQTSGPVDDGRAAPQEAPNTGTATTEAPKTDAPKTEAPKAETPAEPQAQGTSSTFDGFKVGGFTFKPGGRIKLDIIRDFSAITSEDSFDTRTIAVDGSDGSNSNLHAKETRLSIDIRGPVEGKELKMYVETDFYGSSSVLRLRQAYGSYGGLLAGQAWSTFVDESNFPTTIDFEAPTAFPQVRQAQARWTSKLGAKGSWSVAVEDNKSSIQIPTAIEGKAEYPMPDLVTNFRYVASRWHGQASFFLGEARFRPKEGNNDDVTLWGGLLSAKTKTFGRDNVYGQYTFGDGVGRYRGGTTAVLDANGELRPVGLTGLMGGYEHFWSDRFSSNVVFSETTGPTKDYYPADFNKDLDYTAVNLLYWFLKDRAWAGVEYLHGRREVIDDSTGSANRLQFAVRFNFPS